MLPSDSKDSEVVEGWQRFVQGLLGVLMLVGAALMAHYYAPPETSRLEQQVRQLSRQLETLQRQEVFSMQAVDDARDSVAYIYGIYRISGGSLAARVHARVAGTGFVVAPGLLATNRHVAEPWYGDREAQAALKNGAQPSVEKLVAYFPGSPIAVELHPAAFAQRGDLAILRMDDVEFTRSLRPLPIAKAQPHVGEPVSVIAYPMGVTGMVAKSPTAVYERLASHRDDPGTASELAALSLIRPSPTFGHIGDVAVDKLIYDAPTARGGSGGPVLNGRGEVVGVNSAYLDGFSGGTLGISASELLPLIEAAQQDHPVPTSQSR